jgi:hypothetical protein
VDMNNHQGPPPRPTIKQAAEYHHMDIKTAGSNRDGSPLTASVPACCG